MCFIVNTLLLYCLANWVILKIKIIKSLSKSVMLILEGYHSCPENEPHLLRSENVMMNYGVLSKPSINCHKAVCSACRHKAGQFSRISSSHRWVSATWNLTKIKDIYFKYISFISLPCYRLAICAGCTLPLALWHLG